MRKKWSSAVGASFGRNTTDLRDERRLKARKDATESNKEAKYRLVSCDLTCPENAHFNAHVLSSERGVKVFFCSHTVGQER